MPGPPGLPFNFSLAFLKLHHIIQKNHASLCKFVLFLQFFAIPPASLPLSFAHWHPAPPHSFHAMSLLAKESSRAAPFLCRISFSGCFFRQSRFFAVLATWGSGLHYFLRESGHRLKFCWPGWLSLVLQPEEPTRTIGFVRERLGAPWSTKFLQFFNGFSERTYHTNF